MKTIYEAIENFRTEYCGKGLNGYDAEQEESKIIEETIDNLDWPKVNEIYPCLEDSRNDDDESADLLFKRAVENWIGDKCKDEIYAKHSTATEQYLDSMTVIIELCENWNK